MKGDAVEVARRLAAALDADDFATAEALLSPDCIYFCAGELLAGPRAVAASYAEASRHARTLCDQVAYDSEVEAGAGPEQATITFTDHLGRGGRRHSYRCRQHLTVGEDGLVRTISHEELAGERAALDAFLALDG